MEQRTSKEIQDEITRRFPAKDKFGREIIWAHQGLSQLVDELQDAKLREQFN